MAANSSFFLTFALLLFASAAIEVIASEGHELQLLVQQQQQRQQQPQPQLSRQQWFELKRHWNCQRKWSEWSTFHPPIVEKWEINKDVPMTIYTYEELENEPPIEIKRNGKRERIPRRGEQIERLKREPIREVPEDGRPEDGTKVVPLSMEPLEMLVPINLKRTPIMDRMDEALMDALEKWELEESTAMVLEEEVAEMVQNQICEIEKMSREIEKRKHGFWFPADVRKLIPCLLKLNRGVKTLIYTRVVLPHHNSAHVAAYSKTHVNFPIPRDAFHQARPRLPHVTSPFQKFYKSYIQEKERLKTLLHNIQKVLDAITRLYPPDKLTKREKQFFELLREIMTMQQMQTDLQKKKKTDQFSEEQKQWIQKKLDKHGYELARLIQGETAQKVEIVEKALQTGKKLDNICKESTGKTAGPLYLHPTSRAKAYRENLANLVKERKQRQTPKFWCKNEKQEPEDFTDDSLEERTSQLPAAQPGFIPICKTVAGLMATGFGIAFLAFFALCVRLRRRKATPNRMSRMTEHRRLPGTT